MWLGVTTHDVTKDVENQAFNLHAMLLWTIHDFPGYGIVGGFSHQGYTACPWCGMDLGAEHLVELGKYTIVGLIVGYVMNIPSDQRKCKITSMAPEKPCQNHGQ